VSDLGAEDACPQSVITILKIWLACSPCSAVKYGTRRGCVALTKRCSTHRGFCPSSIGASAEATHSSKSAIPCGPRRSPVLRHERLPQAAHAADARARQHGFFAVTLAQGHAARVSLAIIQSGSHPVWFRRGNSGKRAALPGSGHNAQQNLFFAAGLDRHQVRATACPSRPSRWQGAHRSP